MTKNIILALLLICYSYSNGQNKKVVLSKFTFHGFAISLTKGDVIRAFGKPKVVYPHYDCGLFAEDLNETNYYQLIYPHFNYIGCDRSRFVLEKVEFDRKGKVVLKYGNKKLSGLTTKADLATIFGEIAKEIFASFTDTDTILLQTEGSDGVRFTFEGGRLTKFEYWTPC